MMVSPVKLTAPTQSQEEVEHHRATRWRVLSTGHAPGAWNMAVDEAICTAVAEGYALPTLRFYGWSPPAVSLGYAQSYTDIDWVVCAAHGIDVVRRPTGGRAILHDNELTYSVIVKVEDVPDGRTVISSYRWLSRGLVLGLSLLGVRVHMGAERTRLPAEPLSHRCPTTACFAKSARCDIMYENRKLVGSAQVRTKGVILQHGSLPLRLNRQLSTELFGESGDLRGAISLFEIPQARRITLNDLEEAVRQGFAEALGAIFENGELSIREKELAQKLVENRHRRADWVRRRSKESRVKTTT